MKNYDHENKRILVKDKMYEEILEFIKSEHPKEAQEQLIKKINHDYETSTGLFANEEILKNYQRIMKLEKEIAFMENIEDKMKYIMGTIKKNFTYILFLILIMDLIYIFIRVI